MAEANKHLEPVWREVRSEFGGEEFKTVTSENSDVLLVEDAPQSYVVKVPRGDNHLAFNQFLTEMSIHSMLAHAEDEPPVRIPRVLAYNNQLPYLALDYIPGVELYSYRPLEEGGLDVGMLYPDEDWSEILAWNSRFEK
jgi:hypothetical protein